MGRERNAAATGKEPRLLLHYPLLATCEQRLGHLLGCLAERGGPATRPEWRDRIKDHGEFADIVGKDLTGRLARWWGGERKAFTFRQKMAFLKPVADVLDDQELAWSAYWIESGCEPVAVRGMKARHEFSRKGGQPILVTEPGLPECRGGPSIHDKNLARAHILDLLPPRKRGRPSKNDTEQGGPQITSDGRHDFPPWYQRIDYQRRRDERDRLAWEAEVAAWEKNNGKICAQKPPHFPDVTDQVSESIRAYGRCALQRIAIYFEGEPWIDFSPLAKLAVHQKTAKIRLPRTP